MFFSSVPVHFISGVKRSLLITSHICWVFTATGALLGAAQPRAVDEESSFPLALCQKSTFPVDLCGHSVLFDISGSYGTAAG